MQKRFHQEDLREFWHDIFNSVSFCLENKNSRQKETELKISCQNFPSDSLIGQWTLCVTPDLCHIYTELPWHLVFIFFPDRYDFTLQNLHQTH